ncbi:MAG TPA: transcription termination/antitermination NusG family protein [Phycisphaerae bacterium]|nr:transcription termination/antitermination NusG family protein [Phycisphaerae bacterium]
MLRLRDNPPMTYPEGIRLRDVAGRWHVACTKARREKALARSLAGAGTAYFLPMVERVSVIRRRRLRSLVPLFGGYAFFAGDEQTRWRVLECDHVARVLTVVDQDRLLSELSHIEQALASGAQLDPFPFLRRHARCRVRCGALAGLEGVVSVRRSVTRLVLQVEMLGQAAALEIEASLLEPAT